MQLAAKLHLHVHTKNGPKLGLPHSFPNPGFRSEAKQRKYVTEEDVAN